MGEVTKKVITSAGRQMLTTLGLSLQFRTLPVAKGPGQWQNTFAATQISFLLIRTEAFSSANQGKTEKIYNFCFYLFTLVLTKKAG